MMTEATISGGSGSVVESARLVAVAPATRPDGPSGADATWCEVIAQMVCRAKADGVALIGPDGLLKALTARVVEAALDEEFNEHLGYDKHDPAGRGSGNSCNGMRPEMVIIDNVGAVEI